MCKMRILLCFRRPESMHVLTYLLKVQFLLIIYGHIKINLDFNLRIHSLP